MPNSSTTITNQIQRALLEIAKSPDATVQERLDAVNLILKAKELGKQRDRTTPRKRSKTATSALSILGG
jgi:hypothetical protein